MSLITTPFYATDTPEVYENLASLTVNPIQQADMDTNSDGVNFLASSLNTPQQYVFIENNGVILPGVTLSSALDTLPSTSANIFQ